MKTKLLLKKRISLLIVSYTLFLNSCHLIPCDLDSDLDELMEKQEDSFFIGEYEVEKFINNSSKIENSSLIVNKNGTFKMHNIPIDVFDYAPDKEIDVSGKWRYVYINNREKDRNYLSFSLEFNKKDSIDNYRSSYKLYLKNNKPVIFIEIGDPDQCSAIRFIKKD